jgi:hypothetical protein
VGTGSIAGGAISRTIARSTITRCTIAITRTKTITWTIATIAWAITVTRTVTGMTIALTITLTISTALTRPTTTTTEAHIKVTGAIGVERPPVAATISRTTPTRPPPCLGIVERQSGGTDQCSGGKNLC